MPIAIAGSGTITGVTAGGLEAGAGPVLMTAQASTSGTSIDFTGIPSWVKRVTVMFSGVSTNGSSGPILRLGSGSIQTTGYGGTSIAFNTSAAAAEALNTTGFSFAGSSLATAIRHGGIQVVNVSGNTWCAFGNVSQSESQFATLVSGSVTLSGILDRIRITTVNGTDTFDAGTINVMYE